MIIEIIDKLGHAQPIRVEGTQVLVRNNQGTPIAVAGEFGPDGAVKTAHCCDAEFQQILNAFGYGRHQVEVKQVQLTPVPSGASKLISP